jgi:hypothetical protein
MQMRLINIQNSLFIILRLRAESWEEGEDDARSACPSDTLGYTHNTMANTTGRDGETPSQSL